MIDSSEKKKRSLSTTCTLYLLQRQYLKLQMVDESQQSPPTSNAVLKLSSQGMTEQLGRYLVLGNPSHKRHTSWDDKAASIKREILFLCTLDSFLLIIIEMILLHTVTSSSSQSIHQYFQLSYETNQSFQVKFCKTLSYMSGQLLILSAKKEHLNHYQMSPKQNLKKKFHHKQLVRKRY